MEIVINIPEGLKKDFETERWTALSCMEMKDALMNGTALPKGHGDLVDASMSYGEWVCTQDGNYECVREGGCENCEYREYQCYTDIRDLPVIIKADRDKSEVRNADSN